MAKECFRGRLVVSLALLLASTAAGCGQEDGTCPAVAGVYQPLYQVRSGTCGPVASDQVNYVPIMNDIQIQKFANVDVETETIVMGCSLNMTQIVRTKTGLPTQQIYGNALDVRNSNLVSGMITLTRYDDAGNMACSGEYDAMLQKNTTTLGGAAAGK